MLARVFTDGSCFGNPGPGGYAAIIRMAGSPDVECSDGSPKTTNNRMEMMGALAGIEAAKKAGATRIEMVSDSQYLVNGMSDWIFNWMMNGWRTANGHDVVNQDLWRKLQRLTQVITVDWTWTRGHVGHPENERCDALARKAMSFFMANRLKVRSI